MAVSLLGIQLTDSGGKVRNVVYPVPDTYTPANMQTFLDTHLDKLDNVLGAKITSAFVTLALSLAGASNLKGTAGDDYPVKVGGLLGFSCTGTPYRTSIYVPTVDRSLIDNSDVIADAGAMATYIASLIGGESAIAISDLHENVIASFLGGRRVARK